MVDVKTESDKERPMMKTIPISKRCRICKEKKLFSEFDINDKIKDKHDTICKSCIENEDQTPHTSDYITSKFLLSVYDQLDCLLAVVENGVELPDDILELLSEIVDQDCRNKNIS